jgi:hypothetical protein
MARRIAAGPASLLGPARSSLGNGFRASRACSVHAVSEHVPVEVRLDRLTVPSVTRVTSAAAEVLVLSTTISSPQTPFTVHSTYVGKRGELTAATHLVLTPASVESGLIQLTHPAHALPVAEDERHLCLYDHLQQLLVALRHAGHDATIEVDDRAVEVVDR